MAIRNIVKEGDERLAKVCRPVEKFDRHLEELVHDMKDTLKLAEGLGLAAPQVSYLADELIRRGFQVPEDLMTVAEAKEAILQALARRKAGKCHD